MLYFDVDGALQTDADGTLQADIDGMLQTSEETIVSGENVVYEAHSDVMLVLSVLQLFVLMVIAFFTIVRRTNND